MAVNCSICRLNAFTACSSCARLVGVAELVAAVTAAAGVGVMMGVVGSGALRFTVAILIGVVMHSTNEGDDERSAPSAIRPLATPF